MKKVNLVVVGGFLGAGKTTCILDMAKYLLSSNKRIGIVTNDQGSQLVDTNFLAREGLPVLEVTGGCFCCNFDEFTNRVNELAEKEMPDVILAEPVGSCTDLVATIFKPLQLKYTRQFTLNPLSIVADPKRVRRLMMDSNSSGFANEINYLFQKQLEEADLIVLNKTDLLSRQETMEITAFLREKFKGVDVMPISAKDNTGIDEWISRIMDSESNLRNIKEIDYEIYAAAEENLGWLNSTVSLESSGPVDINAVIKRLMSNLREQFARYNHEIAHLKIYGVGEKDWAKASLTSIFDEVDFNRKMGESISHVNMIINARVNTEPETLRPIIEQALSEICESKGIKMRELTTECFKPSKPNPTHRVTE